MPRTKTLLLAALVLAASPAALAQGILAPVESLEIVVPAVTYAGRSDAVTVTLRGPYVVLRDVQIHIDGAFAGRAPIGPLATTVSVPVTFPATPGPHTVHATAAVVSGQRSAYDTRSADATTTTLAPPVVPTNVTPTLVAGSFAQRVAWDVPPAPAHTSPTLRYDVVDATTRALVATLGPEARDVVVAHEPGQPRTLELIAVGPRHSSIVVAPRPTSGPVAAPTSLTAGFGEGSGTLLSWTAPPQPHVQGYRIYRDAPASRLVAVVTAADTSFTDHLTLSGVNTWRVSALSGTFGAMSEATSLEVLSPGLGFEPTLVEPGRVRLEWTVDPRASESTGFRLERSVPGFGTLVRTLSKDARSFDDIVQTTGPVTWTLRVLGDGPMPSAVTQAAAPDSGNRLATAQIVGHHVCRQGSSCSFVPPESQTYMSKNARFDVSTVVRGTVVRGGAPAPGVEVLVLISQSMWTTNGALLPGMDWLGEARAVTDAHGRFEANVPAAQGAVECCSGKRWLRTNAYVLGPNAFWSASDQLDVYFT